MDIKQQQQLVENVLPILHLVDPTLKIAGGCPRDWYLGKPAEDVDVYLRSHNRAQDIDQVCYRLGVALGSEIVPKDPSAEGYQIQGISCVRTTVIEDLSFDLIFMQGPVSQYVPAMFGASISKITLNTDAFLPVPTKEFTESVENKVITFEKGVEEGSPYVKKLQDKFPEYSFKYYTPPEPKVKKKNVNWIGSLTTEQIREYLREHPEHVGPVSPAHYQAWRSEELTRLHSSIPPPPPPPPPPPGVWPTVDEIDDAINTVSWEVEWGDEEEDDDEF